MYLPKEFYIAELKYIEMRLAQLPDVKVGYHRDNKIIRWKDPSLSCGWKRIYYDKVSPKAKAVADEIDYLNERKKSLLKISGLTDSIIKNYTEGYEIKKLPALFDKAFFDNAKDQASNYKIEDTQPYKQYHMFSRAECLIAQELDRLGLIYKYDVAIPALNRNVDFLIYIPSLDCCILLEYFGMMGNQGYKFNTASKISEYLEYGCRINYDFSILSGNKTRMPSVEEIDRTLALCIANLCDERVVYKT